MNKNQTINLTIFDMDKGSRVERTFYCEKCVINDRCNGDARDCKYLFVVSSNAPRTIVKRKDENNIDVRVETSKYDFEKTRKKLHEVTQNFVKHR